MPFSKTVMLASLVTRVVRSNLIILPTWVCSIIITVFFFSSGSILHLNNLHLMCSCCICSLLDGYQHLILLPSSGFTVLPPVMKRHLPLSGPTVPTRASGSSPVFSIPSYDWSLLSSLIHFHPAIPHNQPLYQTEPLLPLRQKKNVSQKQWYQHTRLQHGAVIYKTIIWRISTVEKYQPH
jgi:hypothetical protein